MWERKTERRMSVFVGRVDRREDRRVDRVGRVDHGVPLMAQLDSLVSASVTSFPPQRYYFGGRGQVEARVRRFSDASVWAHFYFGVGSPFCGFGRRVLPHHTLRDNELWACSTWVRLLRGCRLRRSGLHRAYAVLGAVLAGVRRRAHLRRVAAVRDATFWLGPHSSLPRPRFVSSG